MANIDIFNISLLYVIVFNIFMTILICIIGKLFNRKVNKKLLKKSIFVSNIQMITSEAL